LKIAVIGTGYVGLVTGTCLAHAGHTVTCIDIDEKKVAQMRGGRVPIYEPGLQELFEQSLASKRLEITTDLSAGIEKAAVIFLALPTPQGADGSADLSAVLGVATQLGPLLKEYAIIVDKSTVPVGTGEQVSQKIREGAQVAFDVVSNPEFLREGLAIQDFMHPDRIVIGTSSDKAREYMQEVYEPFVEEDAQLVFMDIRSAEMTKYAANSFLAMKVSFMNEIANLCELANANVDSVRQGIGPDKRIGNRFLYAGIGYGGSCFPKDVQALQRTAESYGYDFRLLESIIAVNTSQKHSLVDKIQKYYNEDLKGKHFALWGLAFKPDTDDIREAPALVIINSLLAQGASVTAYDPQAMPNVKKYYGDKTNLDFTETALEATHDADALLIVTEWEEFCSPDFEMIKKSMHSSVIFDGRNIYHPENMRKLSFDYSSIGRPNNFRK
jgi:UDPglucose 6-dehydrogenase